MSRQNAQHSIGKQSCPECGVIIPSYPRYTPWCEQCNWNLQPNVVAPPQRWQQYISEHLAKRLFDQMRRERPANRLTHTHCAALLLATCVYLIHVALFWLGGGLIWSGEFGRIIVGTIIVALTIRALVIRYDELPPEMMLANDKQFPALNQLIREIAQRLDVPMPQIVLSEQFTATFARVGSRRQSLMCIGIPFLALLNSGEMVSLFGHELSHDQDGAWTRSLYVQNARTSVESWNSLLAFHPLTSHSNNLLMWCGGSLAIVSLPLRAILFGCLQLFELLAYHDSQRAEYVADMLSLAVAGNRHAPQLLRKSYYRYLGALHEAYKQAPLHQKYQAVQYKLVEIPHREKERVWRIAQMQRPRIKSSHPTVTERIQLLEHRRDVPPALTIDAAQFAAIQAELSKWPQIMHQHKMAYLREIETSQVVSKEAMSAVSAD